MRREKTTQIHPSSIYKTIRRECEKAGMTPMRSAISATLALEELMNDSPPRESLAYLAAIGSVAIPDLERTEPANDQEAKERQDMLDAYNHQEKKD